MNIVLYAGDKKYHSVLEPIAKELKENTSSNFLFYYTKSTQLLYPAHHPHIGQFEYDGQINDEEGLESLEDRNKRQELESEQGYFLQPLYVQKTG